MVTWITVAFMLLIQVIFQETVSGFAPFSRGFRSFRSFQVVSSNSDEPALRIGHGFDIHRLIEGTKLIIGSTLLRLPGWYDYHQETKEAYVYCLLKLFNFRRSGCSIPCRS